MVLGAEVKGRPWKVGFAAPSTSSLREAFCRLTLILAEDNENDTLVMRLLPNPAHARSGEVRRPLRGMALEAQWASESTGSGAWICRDGHEDG